MNKQKICYFFLFNLFALLCFSCAGSGSDGSGDVGYLCLGTSRAGLASYGMGLYDLKDVTLKDCYEGGEKQTLKTWSDGTLSSGATIPVKTGRWSFTLEGHNAPCSEYFLAKADKNIAAGVNNTVTFIMYFSGVPAASAQSGYLIFESGYATSPNSNNYILDAKAINGNVESVAVRYGDNVYGISLNPFVENQVDVSTCDNLNLNGWELPSTTLCEEIWTAMTDISFGLSDAKSYASDSDYINGNPFWTKTVANGRRFYSFSTDGSDIAGPDAMYYVMVVKRYN